ncbi:MAG: S8 family serine peptidase [Firmicutes bacterium]|nr:S8 family serine peptidase [Bacillota bacterium]
MKRNSISKSNKIKKRLTSFLIAVVFVLGTAILPADIYGAEPETTDANALAVEATDAATAEAEEVAAEDKAADDASTEAAKAEGQETEEAAAETAVPENAAAGTEEGAAADEAVIEELTDAVEADLDQLDESEYDGFIYKLKDDTTTKEIKEMEGAIDELGEDQEVSEVIEEEMYTADSIETIAEVAEPDTIECIEPNYKVQAMGTNDEYYEDYGWYLDMINAPYVWNKGMFGKGVKVAVLDSGVDQDHEDLCNVSYTSPKNVLNDSTDVADDFGHGTSVTGVIAASYNNGKGMTGVMPGVTIMPIKVLNSTGGGSVTGIIAGIDFAIKNKATVINMSFGGTLSGETSTMLSNACQKAADAGIILVAAAGNTGDTAEYYPAAYSTVVSVASVGSAKRHSSFSTHNKYVAVSAPGEYICMPSINEYVDYNGNPVYYTADPKYAGKCCGTSFSTPQVTAMAAMAKALDPSINYNGFMDVIKKTSTDLGPIKGFDYYFGYGLMDLSKAYRYVAGDIFMYSASLSTTSYVYNNTVRTPAVTLKNGTKTLARSKYTVTYPTGRKAVGTYKVTVKNKGKFTGSKTLTFKIMPPLVRALKSPVRYKKKLIVRWYAMTSSQKTKYKGGITGYQVRVSRNSNFSNAKYVKVTGATKTYAVVKNLKRKTTYYIQYRSYKTVGSTTYYSKWSAKKKAKTK